MGLFIISTLLLALILAEKIFFFNLEPLMRIHFPTVISLSLLTVFLVIGFVSFIKRSKERKIKVYSVKFSKATIIAAALTLVVIGTSFYLNYQKKALSWDAVALYDARAKFLQEGMKFSGMVSLSRFDPQNSYYYVLYPPYTSLVHHFWYKLGITLPIGVFYSIILLLLGLVTLLATEEHLGKTLSTFLVFLVVANNNIFASSLAEYTNLPYSLHLLLGVLLLVGYINKREKWRLFYGISLVVSSQWIRFLEPLWVAVIFAFSVAILDKKNLNKNLPIVGIFAFYGLSEYLSWGYFVNQVAKSPAIVSFGILRIMEPLVGVFTGSLLAILIFFVSSWGVLVLIHLSALTVSFSRLKKQKHILFLISFILGCMLIYLFGLYFVSFQSVWWDKLGGSLVRSSTFLIPISGYLLFYYFVSIMSFGKMVNSPIKDNRTKGKLEERITKICSNLFPFFWLFSFFLALVEVFIYPGFIIKHFFISPYYAFSITVILGLISRAYSLREKNLYYIKLINFNQIVISISGLSLISFTLLESLHYPNYVFSTFHLHPDALIWPLLLNLFLCLLEVKVKFDTKKLLTFNKKIFRPNYLLLILILWIFSLNIPKLKLLISDQFDFMANKPFASYDDKMREAVGPIFYNHILFVKDYVPEEARILIPPQGFPWPQSGNLSYTRYFLFPRKLANGKEYDPNHDYVEEDIDYVLLTWGETTTTQYGFTHTWPKFDVPAERIMYYSEDSQVIEIEGNYNYKDYLGKKVWGIIKVKK